MKSRKEKQVARKIERNIIKTENKKKIEKVRRGRTLQ